MRLMQRMLTVTYLWPCFLCVCILHITQPCFIISMLLSASDRLHSVCILSVFLHYWAEVKVNKLSLRSVCPILSTPGLFPNVLLVICYHPWVRKSRKMGSMEGRWEIRVSLFSALASEVFLLACVWYRLPHF